MLFDDLCDKLPHFIVLNSYLVATVNLLHLGLDQLVLEAVLGCKICQFFMVDVFFMFAQP